MVFSSSEGGAGTVRREVLDRSARTKINTVNDLNFYNSPRLCTHVDEEFLGQLTELYRQRVMPGGKVSGVFSQEASSGVKLRWQLASATPSPCSPFAIDPIMCR